MKIIKGDTVYIQAKDLKKLKDSSEVLSHSLLFAIHIIFNNYHEYDDDEFIPFKLKDFGINNISWILDFDKVIKYNEYDITTLCNNLINQRNYAADIYNNLSQKGRIKNRRLLSKTNDLEYQIECYKDILEIMNGNKKIELPEGVEFPDGFIKESKVKKLIDNLRK